MWSSRRQRPASEQLSNLGPAAWAQAQTQTTHIPSAHVGAGSTNGAGVGAGRVRPVGGSTINRDRLATRTAHVGGGSTNGGMPSGRRGRLQAATSRLSRHLPTQLANFLINNMRNNAPTASVGSAVAAVGDTSASPSGEAAPIAPTTPAAPLQTVLPTSTPTPRGDSNNLRSQLRTFLNDSLFVGVPINEQTIPGAIGRALDWFGESLVYLPQYERPEYNSRDSVCNILRVSLRLIIELCNGAPAGVDSAQFEQSLKQICDQFRKRLYSVLFLCLGSANAELYWRQLMRLLCAPMRSSKLTPKVIVSILVNSIFLLQTSATKPCSFCAST